MKTFNWKNKIILIAEDEDSNYILLQYFLAKTQAQLLWAKNGKTAIEQCKSNKNINIVLMDIKMPELDGFEATKQIKKFRKDLPILAVTAFALDKDREESIKAGCDDFIAKPVDRNELLAVLEKYLEE